VISGGVNGCRSVCACAIRRKDTLRNIRQTAVCGDMVWLHGPLAGADDITATDSHPAPMKFEAAGIISALQPDAGPRVQDASRLPGCELASS